jgi:ParE toxin of type II toxin-antitoxin system, parDE
VPQVFVTPRAVADLHALAEFLALPGDTMQRVQRSLVQLERFPMSGRELSGRWRDARFVLGPWPWMILVYVFDQSADEVYVVAVHDARNASSAVTRRS